MAVYLLAWICICLANIKQSVYPVGLRLIGLGSNQKRRERHSPEPQRATSYSTKWYHAPRVLQDGENSGGPAFYHDRKGMIGRLEGQMLSWKIID